MRCCLYTLSSVWSSLVFCFSALCRAINKYDFRIGSAFRQSGHTVGSSRRQDYTTLRQQSTSLMSITWSFRNISNRDQEHHLSSLQNELIEAKITTKHSVNPRHEPQTGNRAKNICATSRCAYQKGTKTRAKTHRTKTKSQKKENPIPPNSDAFLPVLIFRTKCAFTALKVGKSHQNQKRNIHRNTHLHIKQTT